MQNFKPIAGILASLVLTLSAAPAVADTIVQSNVTFAFKFLVNDQEPKAPGAKTVLNYSTITIKNADILAMYAQSSGTTLSKKARIVRRVRFVGSVLDDAGYWILDGNNKYPINSHLFFDADREQSVFKMNINTAKGSGTISTVRYNDLILTFPTGDEEAEELEGAEAYIRGSGLEKLTMRLVRVGTAQYTLDTFSHSVSGNAGFIHPVHAMWLPGVVQGSLKVSGPKIHAETDL